MILFFSTLFIFSFQNCYFRSDVDELLSFPQENFAVYFPEVISEFPHRGEGVTQGLIFNGDTLYESTGIYGHSSIRTMDASGQNYQELFKLPASIYGEGIAIHNNCLYVLSWRENTCFVYDLFRPPPLHNSPLIKEIMYYTGEGWGICKDKNSFWMSSGDFHLIRRSLDDFSILEKRKITLNQIPLGNLNELEYVNGVILANVWQSNFVVIYDPQKDQTVGIIELGKLIQIERSVKNSIILTEPEAVLNGIAYHKKSESLYVTGKFWSKIFQIKLKRNNKSKFRVPQLRPLEKH